MATSGPGAGALIQLAAPRAEPETEPAGASLREMARTLDDIRDDMVEAGRRALEWRDLADDRRASAGNLVHYLTLRRRDRRPVQRLLAAMGLSSLGHAEAHALTSVEAVRRALRALERTDADLAGALAAVDDHRAQIARNCRVLFGPPPAGRDVRIMVTMPSEAATDPSLMRALLASGMDAMRINAAHDDADAWLAMIGHLRRAQEHTGRACRVVMDLAGPRLRTGPLAPGPPVLHWRPTRDAYGRVLRPARIWIAGPAVPAPGPADAVLPVAPDFAAALEIGETLRLDDARDKRRDLVVAARGEGGVWAEAEQSAYVMAGAGLRRGKAAGAPRGTSVGPLPATAQSIVVRPGDTLLLTRDDEPGRPAVIGADGHLLTPGRIGVSIPSVLDDVRPGDAIWFDDGRIGGTIREVCGDAVAVTVGTARARGVALGAEKGINLPDTTLRLPSLTPKDVDDLRFFTAHADVIGYSFVRSVADVEAIQAHLASTTTCTPGIILKIETRRAFEQLPVLLLALMKSPAAGVMIARGDLAVECGFERLAELQEEMLSMAEASHLPVIWATQVLESLAKDGLASRAEITDAAMAERADCVMLNKGPHVVEAVRSLDDILVRMQQHQVKKRPALRALAVAERYLRDGLDP